MKRKIIKLAEKTLVVSLPTTWIDSQQLSKGDELECVVQDNQLVLVPPQQKSKLIKEISLNGISERVLRWQISSLHKQGYDEIVVTDYSPEQYEVLQDLITHLFIGFIVKEKSKLRIVIGEVTVVDVSEFDAMLRRGFRLLIQSFEELIELCKEQQETSSLVDIEKDSNKVTNFCERLLNKNLMQKEKGHFWYVVAWNIEKIIDNFKYVATEYKTLPQLNESQEELLEKTKAYAQGYYECFYQFDYEELVRLTQLKNELLISWKQELQKPELALFSHYMLQAILQIADFSASMIALKDE